MTLHDKEHPLICLYKETIGKNHPIILVIGREPNNKTPMINQVGLYDFDGTSHGRRCSSCAFWNMSYKLIAEINNLKITDLKQKCRDTKSSVIGYTDSLPQTIMNQETNKNKIRKRIINKIIEGHINNIFSKDILDRVKLIILSGLSYKNFALPVKLIKEKSDKRGIRLIEVPFFYPSNYKKINLDKNDTQLIKKIFEEWKNSV